MQTTRRGIISKDALIACFQLNVGELEQLNEWFRRYPDLLVEVENGCYEVAPAVQAVMNVIRYSRP
jgi:hypothetical protein